MGEKWNRMEGQRERRGMKEKGKRKGRNDGGRGGEEGVRGGRCEGRRCE